NGGAIGGHAIGEDLRGECKAEAGAYARPLFRWSATLARRCDRSSSAPYATEVRVGEAARVLEPVAERAVEADVRRPQQRHDRRAPNEDRQRGGRRRSDVAVGQVVADGADAGP